MFTKMRPLHDRVLIKRLENQEKKTAGGLIITDKDQEKDQRGVVVAVGNGRTTDSGELIPLTVSIGDTVLFAKYSGIQVDSEHSILRENDILGIIQ